MYQYSKRMMVHPYSLNTNFMVYLKKWKMMVYLYSFLKRYYNLPCQTASILRPRSLDRLNEDLDCALLALDTVPWVVDDTMAGREIPQAGRLARKIVELNGQTIAGGCWRFIVYGKRLENGGMYQQFFLSSQAG